MAYPNSVILIPELQAQFRDLVVLNSKLTRSCTIFPSNIKMDLIYPAGDYSFIRMLFDDEYSYHHYFYLYRKVDPLTAPGYISTRMGVISPAGQMYVCDSTAICNVNFFQLEVDDFTMLNKLLQYRMDSTSVIIADIDYYSLSTRLSKLIYIYLDLKINHSWLKYDDAILISDPNHPLEVAYEFYVVEEIFSYISSLVTIQPQPT